MVDPLNFGTQSGLPYDVVVNATNQPHSDYWTNYTLDHSIRLWEPARWQLSEPGLFQMEAGFNAQVPFTNGLSSVPTAKKVAIAGFKGDIWLAMDGRTRPAGAAFTEPVGDWTDTETGDGITVTPAETYAALNGYLFDGNSGTNWHRGVPPLRCPVFICMYRGTYTQIDDNTGWEIDSGPSDDPDTLLGLDITSPSVLESPRMDWWTRVDVPFPRQAQARGILGDPNVQTYPAQMSSTETGLVKVPMDLSTNKYLGPDQVLWLHVRTGVIRTMLYADGVMYDALYRNHSFLCWSSMSMLASGKPV